MDLGNLLEQILNEIQRAMNHIKQCAAKLQSFNQRNNQRDTMPIIKLSTEEQSAMTKTKGLFCLYVGFTILLTHCPILV